MICVYISLEHELIVSMFAAVCFEDFQVDEMHGDAQRDEYSRVTSIRV